MAPTWMACHRHFAALLFMLPACVACGNICGRRNLMCRPIQASRAEPNLALCIIHTDLLAAVPRVCLKVGAPQPACPRHRDYRVLGQGAPGVVWGESKQASSAKGGSKGV